MTKTLVKMTTILLAMAFIMGQLPMYSCLEKDTVHLLSSCCEKEVVAKIELETCCDEGMESDSDSAILKSICCDSLNADLSLFSNLSLTKVEQESHQLFFITTAYCSVETSVDLQASGNNSPPVDDPNLFCHAPPLYLQYSSFLC